MWPRLTSGYRNMAAIQTLPRFLLVVGLLIAMVNAYHLPDDLFEQLSKRKMKNNKNAGMPHKEDPEIAVCDKQIKRGDKCGSRPLCCMGSTCQMFNTMYRTFMDCPHGVKDDECICIEESLASRTDFSEYYQ